jgi:hypothetical protein
MDEKATQTFGWLPEFAFLVKPEFAFLVKMLVIWLYTVSLMSLPLGPDGELTHQQNTPLMPNGDFQFSKRLT